MRFVKGFYYAFRGIYYVFSTQLNFRVHLLAAAAVILLGIFLQVSITEWLILLICIGAVLALEAMNSALEMLADSITKDYHELIGKAKDMAAASVLLASFFSAIIGLLIFLPKILKYLN